ncbi:hypothetical protein [Arthrobacter sp. UYCu712]|uniref:hypothetical protein n=1 Tax=Arthrobacter sp. UYCu712 TaxID=3156340 RepID=UPI003397DEAC
MTAGMFLPFGGAVERLRRRLVVDPYSREQTQADWTDPLRLSLDGAFVASSSGTAQVSEDRSYIITTKSLYLTDAGADVLAGDRIVSAGITYKVPTKPEADTNPFTGWQPVLEIPLQEVTG